MTLDVPLQWLRARDGDGPLVVVAHGLEDRWQSWWRLAGRLDPSWRVVALDLPWKPGSDYAWRTRARPGAYIEAAFERLGGAVDGVVGHSFGSNAVLEALCGGLQVPAVVLTAPFYRPADVPVTWTLFDRSREHFDRHMRDGLLLQLGPRGDRLDPGLLDVMVTKAVDRIGPAGFLTVFEQFTATAWLDLAAVTTPVLVLAGRRDPSLSGRRAESLSRAMPTAEVVLDDAYDHFCHVRQADDVARRATAFLRSVWDAVPGPTTRERTA